MKENSPPSTDWPVCFSPTDNDIDFASLHTFFFYLVKIDSIRKLGSCDYAKYLFCEEKDVLREGSLLIFYESRV